MSQFSPRCFSTGPNKLKSSQDYINQKTAKTLYTTAASNTKSNVSDNIQAFIAPSPDYCLASVGGVNTKSYDLLLNLTKGKYYAASNLQANVKNVDCSPNITSCVTVDISGTASFAQPDYTYGMYEGPFLTSIDASMAQITYDPACLPPTLQSSLVVDASNSTVCNYSFATMVSKEKLRNFAYPFKFKIK
jgi:hypothetical protein